MICSCKMMFLWLLFMFCFSPTRGGGRGRWNPDKRLFPPGFRFGTATSAYQIEGAWNTDGKGESILDHYYHSRTTLVADGTTGDKAADSYHQIKRDVEMMRQMGMDYYRFSISWSRVLPTGFNDIINEKGLRYYDALLDELKLYNIEPMATMYHYDLPQPLQDMGGWTNPMISKWFEDYAQVLFDRFAHRIKYWITVTNPAICFDMYSGKMPPALHSEGTSDYICAKNMLLAHANAYRLYNETYRAIERAVGLVGIAINVNWADPLNINLTEHNNAAALFRNFTFGMFVNPIWGERGDWPPLVKEIVAKKSAEQGLPTSRLPAFSKAERELIMRSSDFLGMNHYTTHFVRFPYANDTKPSLPHPYRDIDVMLSQGELWAQSKSPWLKGAPYGLYKACVLLNQVYHNPPIIVTEHGWSTDKGIADPDRVDNMREYMKAALFSLEDGTDLRGLTIWSLMDTFQWNAGYTERFGLFEVDFASPKKPRTPRHSAVFLRDVVHGRKLYDEWQPASLHLNISTRRLKEKKTREEL